MMKRIAIALLTIAAVMPGAPAQDIEPEEPGIVLPQMLLEVEDLSVESIDAALPEEQAPGAPEVAVPLPDEGELTIPEEAFSIPLPGQQEPEVLPAGESSFYSEGVIGAGSMNHILGAVSLYKLGSEPRFRLQFSHEGMDGYGQRLAGAGFFHREDALGGSLSYEDPSLQLTTELEFLEQEEGLQGIGDYHSATHRFVAGSGDLSYRVVDWFSLTAGFSGSGAGMVLSKSGDAEQYSASEARVSPRGGVIFTTPWGGIDLVASYDYRGLLGVQDSAAQTAGAALGVDATLPWAMYFEAQAGFSWLGQQAGFRYPFSIALAGSIEEAVSYRIEGGYRVEQLSFAHLWKDMPLLGVGAPFTHHTGWYTDAALTWLLSRAFSIDGGVAYDAFDHAVVPDSSVDPTTGLYTYQIRSLTSVTPSFGLTWKLRDVITLSTGWSWHMLDRMAYMPEQYAYLEFEVTEPAGRYGGGLFGEFSSYNDTVSLPELGASGFIRVSSGVQFSLEVTDVLAPLLEEGRKTYGPYEEPGFRATLKTHISL